VTSKFVRNHHELASHYDMNKEEFVIREFLHFSIQAGFSTRNEDYPVYDFESSGFSLGAAKALKEDIRKFLMSSCTELQGKRVSEGAHIKRIEDLSAQISRSYRSMLNRGRFRIGVSQKIINLFLKYLWSVNLIKEPHHCPFDNIIKLKLQKYTDGHRLVYWTEMKSLKEYMNYVSAASRAAEKEKTSIAKWEMNHWKRR
jgi:hypothetical protein